MSVLAEPVNPARVTWRWILDARSDLRWYIGSALAGWLYVALVLALGRGLAHPLTDPVFTLSVGDHRLAVNLQILVVLSWAWFLDSPHVFATLARTYFDPDEWARHRKALIGTFAWFLAGPAAVLIPYLVDRLHPLPAGALAIGGVAFTVFFRLWAYYHVVRQHWGFLVLYQRKGGESDPVEARWDRWFFNLSLYLPLLMFMSAPWYSSGPFPPTGLHVPLGGGLSIARVLHPICLALYPTVLVAYCGFQWTRWSAGSPRNGPKLLFLLAIVPLHLMVFVHPLLVFFIVPIVTVGHNLQYHRIVWTYGQRTYAGDPTRRSRWTGPIFRNVWLYALLGLVFTFGCYQGPWIEFIRRAGAARIDHWLIGGLGLIAGTGQKATLGAQITAWFFTGWAMQHYALDARIWRLRRDAGVARALDV
jgi:hypothetical protein